MSQNKPPVDNPFKNLDKSQYRDARDPARPAPERLKKAGKAQAQALLGDDEQLFAALMADQGVGRLGGRKKVAKAEAAPVKTAQIANKEPEQASGSAPAPQAAGFSPGKSVDSANFPQKRGKLAETPLTLGEHSAFASLKAQAADLPPEHEKPVQLKPAPAEAAATEAGALPASPEQSRDTTPPMRAGHTNLPDTWQADAEAVETDEHIFAQAMFGVRTLNGSGRDVPLPPPAPKPGLKLKPAHPLQDFLDGKIEFSLEYTEEFLEGHVKGLDSQVVNKMKAGGYSFEAHLDLHGLNAAQAWEALVGFFRSSYHKGHRCVLVVPGRGLNSPGGNGVLRERLQTWFTKEPFKYVILAFSTALAKHGGAGALYVLLRKQKKSRGKIAWDIIPSDADLLD